MLSASPSKITLFKPKLFSEEYNYVLDPTNSKFFGSVSYLENFLFPSNLDQACINFVKRTEDLN
jgi:hypothetical protein